MSKTDFQTELNKQNIENVLPLTSLQTGMLYHDLVERGQGQSGKSYNQQLSFRISGPLNKVAFEKSWQALINRHAALRTVYKHDKAAEPVQIVLKQRNFKLYYNDFTAYGNIEKSQKLQDIIIKDRSTGFDLESELLLRLTLVKTNDLEHWLVWSFHHIVLDGWCITPLQQELFNLYKGFLHYESVKLPPAPDYSDYVQWIKRQDLHQGFWHQQLKGFNDVTSAPLAIAQCSLAQEKDVEQGYSLVTATIKNNDFQNLVSIGEKCGATLSTLVHTLWGIYLAKVNATNDVVFGSVQSTRPMARGMFDDLIGLCINTIACRIQLTDEISFSELAKQTQHNFLAYIEHGTTPLSEIKAQCPTSKVLFDHYIAFENYPASPVDEQGREQLTQELYADEMTAFMPTSYPFHLSIFPKSDELEIAFKYQPNKVEVANINSIAESFIQLAIRLIDNSEQTIKQIPLLNKYQHEIVKQQCKGEKRTFKHQNIMALYQDNARDVKENIALIEGELNVTHQQLDRAANILAKQILDTGNTNAVALFGYAGVDMIIAMFACLKLGVPYIPLDPTNPIKRNKAILTAANAHLILCNCNEIKACEQLSLTTISVNLDVLLSHEKTVAHNDLMINPQPESIAYIIFTSGSTGVPKGVPVSQQALLNYVMWSQEKFSLNCTTQSILITSFYFDLGYTALFGSLLNGGTLHIANEQQRRDPLWLNDYLNKTDINLIKLTPSYLHMLLKSLPEQTLFTESNLKTLILGGEELNFSDLRYITKDCPKLDIYNHYGPSENTIGCCAYRLTAEDLIKQYQLIGKPAFNVENYVCAPDMTLLPAYVEGDLYLTGEQLIHSYLDPENNSERLILNPALSNKVLYKSGDRAYIDHEGQLIFSGREAQSCKVDGYRIDLQSIQQVLIEHSQIKDALVTHFKDETAQSKIIALLIPETGYTITPESLRSWLAGSLPVYMLPAEFILVSRFPINANGKLDRKQLVEFWQHSLQSKVEKSTGKPVNHTEFVLLKIWQKVLFRDQISVDDDFFALGGHSIKAILCLGEIRKQLDTELPIQSIFNNPTISKLAKYINQTHFESGVVIAGEQHDLLPVDTRCKDAKQIVYCLPPAIGTSTIYKELFMALGLPLHAYGFQCGGFMPGDSETLSLDELADVAVTQIYEHYQSRASHIKGVLMGYSFGAILALAVGKKLEAKGICLPMLLIDSSLSHDQGLIEYSLSALRENNYWRGVIGILEEHCSEAQFNLITTGSINNQQRLINYLATNDTTLLNSAIVCLEASANLEPANMFEFAEKTSQAVRVLKTPGDHFSIFQPPNVEVLLDNLRGSLNDLSKESRSEVT